MGNIIMVVIATTVAAETRIGCFLCAPCYSKHFTEPNSFNLDGNPARGVL